MISVLKKIWVFSEKEQKNIRKSVFLSFIYAIFNMFQVGAIYYVIIALVEGNTTNKPAWVSLILLVISILGRAITNRFAQLQQTHAGYFMVANKRIYIGNKLKTVPMGYFNEKSLGEITGVTTTILTELENTAPMALVTILTGFINALVFTIFILIFDLRVGILVSIGTILYLIVLSAMQKKAAVVARKRQQSEAELVSAVLEQVRGMSVIKSFNLRGKGDKKLQNALRYNRDTNLETEKIFTPYTIVQEMVLNIFSIGMILFALMFYFNSTMSLTQTLITIIMSFMVFKQIASTGSGMALLRIVESSINQANQMDSIPQMDIEGIDITPENHEITFDNVNFSYNQKEILHDISVNLKDKTTTAIIGPSGSGKTTMCNLISRFWDVDSGSIKIGGKDVREYTLESLMNEISMVFQNVYLFADTIENNIKFGKPEATHEEVLIAAKKACCDDFISKLPNGYETIIGENGASISGGERQRLSIARAMLKDSPIVIFDEATANVDPENEDRLQKAIEELTRDKTIIMIAHRLKTVRNADKILVIDSGNIVQEGDHEKLITEDGIYKNFISERKEAVGWKL